MGANKVVVSIIGVVAVIAIAALFGTACGGGGNGGSAGGGANPQALILETAPFVAVQNVAAILNSESLEEIPQQLTRFIVFNMPGSNFENPEAWKDEWRDTFSDGMPGWLGNSIELDQVTYVVAHGLTGTYAQGTFGLVIAGDFDFDDIREALDESGLKESDYRDFETWDDLTIALLEDRGIIVFSKDIVQPFLKALDAGEGFLDDENPLKQALDKEGKALAIHGDANCASSLFFSISSRRCEALVEAIEGGDAYTNNISGVYVFRSENSAEDALENIEDAIEDQELWDADIENIERDGELVTYKVTIHEESVPPPAAATVAPAAPAATTAPRATAAPTRQRVSPVSTQRPTAGPPVAQTSPETDREALVALYNATGGPNWRRNNNWLSDVPISEWEDVATDGNGRVTVLFLYRNQLSGEIPPELGNLANLTTLRFDENQLSGEIPPELGNLANLRVLFLDENQLSGEIPPELGNLASLERLILSDNQLSGEIPPELGNLSNLTGLDLSENQLSGEIPPWLGNLANLTQLGLSGNQLSGEIPPELGNLSNLTGLDLSENQLSGEIPPWLGNLANLTQLGLSGNQLSGEIPPELGNLASLEWLLLDNNQLSGEIPPELGNLSSLSYLYLQDNDLSGCVPMSLEDQLPPAGLPFC